MRLKRDVIDGDRDACAVTMELLKAQSGNLTSIRRSVMAVALLLNWFMGAGATFGQVEREVGFQPRTWAIAKAKLVISPEKEIPSGTLVIRNGFIVAAGSDVPVPPEAEVIDGSGLTVYPGFLDAGNSHGLPAPAQLATRAGRSVDYSKYALSATAPDHHERLTPEFSARDHLAWEAAAWESRRKWGITAVHVVPRGRIASGWSALVSTSGAPARESLLGGDLFSEFEFFHPGGKNYPETRMGAVAHLRQTFLDARHNALQREMFSKQVAGIAPPAEDVVLEGLAQVTARRAPALFVVDDRDAVGRALQFCREQDLPALIWGGYDVHRAADELSSANSSVLLRIDWGDEPKLEPTPPAGEKTPDDPPVVNDPLRVRQRRIEQWREKVAMLKELHAKKIRCGLSGEGLKDPSELFKAVRQMIQAGCPREVVLGALTREAAVLFGQEKRLGTLEPGKLAHLAVWTGPFDHEQSRVRHVFIDGLKFDYHPDAKPVAPPVPPTKGTPTPETLPLLQLTGVWNVTIDGSGGAQTATLDMFQAAGGRGEGLLSGLFKSEQGDGRVASGSVRGKKFDFVVAIGAGAQTLELKFAGEGTSVTTDKISGLLTPPFGAAAKWSAIRNPPPVVPPSPAPPRKNPVQLKLDPDDGEASNGQTPEKNKPDAGGKSPATATKANTPAEHPTELDTDRRQRPVRTGGRVLIKGGTVLTAIGPPLLKMSVLVKNGKIAAIGPDLKAEPGMHVIDATGQYVMPGIIDTHVHIMFADNFRGVNEATLSIVPEVRVGDVLVSEDVDAYRGLAGGVTTVRVLHGSANVIGGQHAVVKLKYGEPMSKQLLADAPAGVKFALGENVKAPQNRFPGTRLGVEATLQRAFFEALDYRRRWMEYRQASGKGSAAALLPPRRDLRLEALVAILEQESFIHCHCYRADEILMLLRVIEGLGFRVRSLQHVLEGYKVAPEIAAHGASCSTFADWWAYKMEAYDAIPWNAAMLHQAGVNVVLKSDFPEPMRHLYLDAAKILRYGNLPQEAALRMITLNGARELGIDRRTGSLEVGKDADIAIFNGHPLNSFSRCETTLIDGEVYFVREKFPTVMNSFKPSSKARDLHVAAEPLRSKSVSFPAIPSGRFALTHATLHPVSGGDIVDGTLLVEGDKIVTLGPKAAIPPDAPTIDLGGLHVYPGMIDAGSALGITEIGRVRETHDTTEGGLFQPDLRAGVAVNPDSELLSVARAGGITSTLIAPNGGVISGQCSLVQLAGWTVPEMVLDYGVGMAVNWPPLKAGVPRVRALREYLQAARAYQRELEAAKKNPSLQFIRDPRYEALLPYLKGEKRLFIDADSEQQILAALQFADREKLKIVIVSGTDAWKVAGELKKRDVPVIVGNVMRAPMQPWDPADSPYANAGRLHAAGVLFCFRSNDASNSRNLPFNAALAVAHGLPEEEGLKAVTWNAAKILGVEQKIGSLAVGRRADLLITDGSPLQPSTQIKGVVIAGKPQSLESKQSRLYERYRVRMKEVSPRK